MNFGQLLLQHLQAMSQQNPNGVGNNFGPIYTQPGLMSIGGQTPMIGGNRFGGTVGVAQGHPFGSFNMNGRILGKFGPQGY